VLCRAESDLFGVMVTLTLFLPTDASEFQEIVERIGGDETILQDDDHSAFEALSSVAKDFQVRAGASQS